METTFKEPNERLENERWAEEMKQQLFTALDHKDYLRAREINKEIIQLVGYGIEYDEPEDPNYED